VPAKAPRKTIKSNPLDRIVIKSTAVTSNKVAPKKVVATKATKKLQ